MFKIIFPVIIVIWVSSCVNPQVKSIDDQLDSWIGVDINQFLKKMGQPVKTFNINSVGVKYS